MSNIDDNKNKPGFFVSVIVYGVIISAVLMIVFPLYDYAVNKSNFNYSVEKHIYAPLLFGFLVSIFIFIKDKIIKKIKSKI